MNIVLLQGGMALGLGFIMLGIAVVVMYIVKTLCKWSLANQQKGSEKHQRYELAYNIARAVFYFLLALLLLFIFTVNWSNT